MKEGETYIRRPTSQSTKLLCGEDTETIGHNRPSCSPWTKFFSDFPRSQIFEKANIWPDQMFLGSV